MCIYIITLPIFTSVKGVGIGLIYLPSVMVVQMYFKKKRAFASSIASSGAGVGVLCMAPVISLLYNKCGWGYTMMILSALMLTCIPFGFLFKPIKQTKAESPDINGEKKVPKSNYGAAEMAEPKKKTNWRSYLEMLIGKGIPKLPKIVYDLVFTTCMVSHILINFGKAVPYAYTVVSMKLSIL